MDVKDTKKMTISCKGAVRDIQFEGIHSKPKVFLLFNEFLFHNTGFLETDFFPFVSGFFRPEKAIKKKKTQSKNKTYSF